MKPLLTALLLLLGGLAANANVTINLGAGNLYNANGSSLMQSGMLIQLVASTLDTTFSTPTDGSYTGNSSDDVVLLSFSVNGGLGTGPNGNFLDSLVINLANYPNLTTGDSIMLRWFPTIAGPVSPTTTLPAAPTAGTAFGQFRTDIVEANNFSNFNWTIPGDTLTIDLNFLTTSQNVASTHPESDGFATMLVAIPEPSTYALLGTALLGAVIARRRFKFAA